MIRAASVLLMMIVNRPWQVKALEAAWCYFECHGVSIGMLVIHIHANLNGGLDECIIGVVYTC